MSDSPRPFFHVTCGERYILGLPLGIHKSKAALRKLKRNPTLVQHDRNSPCIAVAEHEQLTFVLPDLDGYIRVKTKNLDLVFVWAIDDRTRGNILLVYDLFREPMDARTNEAILELDTWTTIKSYGELVGHFSNTGSIRDQIFHGANIGMIVQPAITPVNVVMLDVHSPTVTKDPEILEFRNKVLGYTLRAREGRARIGINALMNRSGRKPMRLTQLMPEGFSLKPIEQALPGWSEPIVMEAQFEPDGRATIFMVATHKGKRFVRLLAWTISAQDTIATFDPPE